MLDFKFSPRKSDGDIDAENAGTPDAGTNAANAGTADDTRTASAPEGRTADAPEKVTIKPPLERHTIAVNIPQIPQVDAPVKKPRKQRESKASSKLELRDLESNISLLMVGVYAMTAKLLKADYFAISKDEADTIAAPLSKIIDRMAITEKLNKYSDGICLVTAAATVTVPRIAIYSAMKAEENKNAVKRTISGTSNNSKPNNTAATSGRSFTTSSSSNVTENPGDISEYIDNSFGGL